MHTLIDPKSLSHDALAQIVRDVQHILYCSEDGVDLNIEWSSDTTTAIGEVYESMALSPQFGEPNVEAR